MVRDIYAFYPLLIKYVDLQRNHWLRNNISNAEDLYNHVSEIFNIWSKSQYFLREEQNFISANEIDNMILIMPTASRRSAVISETSLGGGSTGKVWSEISFVFIVSRFFFRVRHAGFWVISFPFVEKEKTQRQEAWQRKRNPSFVDGRVSETAATCRFELVRGKGTGIGATLQGQILESKIAKSIGRWCTRNVFAFDDFRGFRTSTWCNSSKFNWRCPTN